MKGCSLLAEVQGSEFVFSGFGRVWSLDVAYDMSSFVEALPDLVQSTEQGRPAEVDLYSQGVECQVELVSRSGLLVTLRCLQQDFARGLAMIDPGMAAIPPLDAWLQSGSARP